MALIRFYIPTEDKRGHKINYVHLLKTAGAQLSIYFGAVSVCKSIGILKNRKGIFYVIESDSCLLSIRKHRKDIESLAKMIKVELNENKLAYFIDTKFFSL